VSVVIATRNRPEMLVDCVTAILAPDVSTAFEVLVVDDSDEGTLDDVWESDPRVEVLRTHGSGTGPARNAGAAAARGRWILFTDDDTLPAAGWVDAAAEGLRAGPELWAIEGPIRSLPWDPLYEHSIEATTPSHLWGANVAYPRDRFLELGGFWGRYREDMEFAIRLRQRGPVGWSEAMAVTHRPRVRRLRGFIVKPPRAHATLALHAIELEPQRRWNRTRLLVWMLRWWWPRRPSPVQEPGRFARWLTVVAVETGSMALRMARLPEWARTVMRDGR
jgi:glycosyltransferase involved in cell wall biosynthesis